jgi:hypothetical protein
LLHRAVEGPVADDRTSGLPASCCCWRGACRGGLRRGGGRLLGRVPDAVRRRPRGAPQRSCAGAGPLPRAGAQIVVRVSTGGLPLMGLTRGCLRASPGGRPRTVTACRRRPRVNARRLLCAGFQQCGSFVKMCAVECALLLGGACRWCGVAACSARSVAVCAWGTPSSTSDVMMPFIVLAETKHGLRQYTRPTSTPPLGKKNQHM